MPGFACLLLIVDRTPQDPAAQLKLAAVALGFVFPVRIGAAPPAGFPYLKNGCGQAMLRMRAFRHASEGSGRSEAAVKGRRGGPIADYDSWG